MCSWHINYHKFPTYRSSIDINRLGVINNGGIDFKTKIRLPLIKKIKW